MPLLIVIVAGAMYYVGTRRAVDQSQYVLAAIEELLDEVAASPVSKPTPGPVAQRLNASTGTLERLAAIIQAHPPGVPGLEIKIEEGDAPPPYGDGAATHRATLMIHGTPEVTLRVAHAGDPNRIEVLGYMMP